MRQIPASELCPEMERIIAQLRQPLFLTEGGEVKAVLLDIDRYHRLLDEIDDVMLANDPEVRQAVADADLAGPEDWVALRDTLLDP